MERILGLCIGIDQYQDQRIRALRYAESDARAMRAVLGAMNPTDAEKSVRGLYGAQATRDGIVEAISDWLRSETTENDVVVLYFGLHGSTEPTDHKGKDVRPYLLPYNTKAHDLYSSAIEMKQVDDWLTKRLGHARAIIAIFDCCFSGAAGGRTFSFASRRSVQTAYRSDDAVASITGHGRVILTATSADELALEDDEIGGGVFTCHVLDFLLHAGRELYPQGLVSVHALWQYVHPEVSRHAKGMRGHMTPNLKQSLTKPVMLPLPVEAAVRKLALERPRFPWREQLSSVKTVMNPLELLAKDVAAFNRAIAQNRVSTHALRASNLKGMDLRFAKLDDLDLEIAELRGADLSHCTAKRTSFKGAYFQGTLLRKADLRDACFEGAYLSGADLAGADLRGARFKDAILSQVVLNRALVSQDTFLGADLDDKTRASLPLSS